MRLNGLNKAAGAVVIAAMLVGGTMSAGAYSASTSVSVPDSASWPYEAFAGFTEAAAQQFADSVKQQAVAQASAALDAAAVRASGNPQAAAAVDQAKKALADFSSAAPADMGEIANDVQQQAVETPELSQQDVIDLLIGMVDELDTSVNDAVDAAEAAVIAKLEEGRAFAHAQLAGQGMPQMDAFIDTQIDLAIAAVRQAFAAMRTQLQAGLDEARDRIIEDLTGVDFGEALPQVVAELEALKAQVTTELAAVKTLLDETLAGISF